MEGLDDIGLTLEKAEAIETLRAGERRACPPLGRNCSCTSSNGIGSVACSIRGLAVAGDLEPA